MIFVLLDGHHVVLRALVESFRVVPLAGANLAASQPLLVQWVWDFWCWRCAWLRRSW